jgi:CRP-like cAMP-binding protein
MEKELILSKVPVFSGLSSDELKLLAQLCIDRTYQRRDVIFKEKSRGTEMYVLRKGQVRIELAIKSKTDFATIHRVQEGEIFGELVLVSKGTRSATAECDTDCDVIALNRNDLKELFRKKPHIGYTIMSNLASILATRLRKTNLQLVACFLWE